jgi:uroporphyrinogen-III synthase
MPSRSELDGIGVLITRPAHQAESLCQRIVDAGGRAVRFPLLRITDASDTQQVVELLRDPVLYDLAIFISPNAVEFGLAALQRHGGPATKTQIAAVGRGTARELQNRLGRAPDLLPTQSFDSEGLLALPELQAVMGKRILILRGNGGRELLGDTLRERGATVEYAEVYRRDPPQPDDAETGWLEKSDLITVTSGEALHNLFEFTAAAHRPALLGKPLITISERVAQQAGELGFTQVMVADGADDEAILRAALSWVAEPSGTERKP